MQYPCLGSVNHLFTVLYTDDIKSDSIFHDGGTLFYLRHWLFSSNKGYLVDQSIMYKLIKKKLILANEESFEVFCFKKVFSRPPIALFALVFVKRSSNTHTSASSMNKYNHLRNANTLAKITLF